MGIFNFKNKTKELEQTSSNDIIIYKKDNGIVYGYFNQKAFDLALYERAKERTNNFTSKNQWDEERTKRAICIDDIAVQKHSILYKPISDGDLVSNDNVLLDLGLDYLNYGEYFKKNNISEYDTLLCCGIKVFSIYTGYFTNKIKDNFVGSINLGNKINDGDLLFTIELTEKIEKKENDKNEVRFDYTLLNKSFVQNLSYLSDICFSEWIVPDYSYVNAGDDVLVISDRTSTPSYNKIVSPFSGILVQNIQKGLLNEKLHKGALLYTLYTSDSSLINYNTYKYYFDVRKDDFTKSYIIDCRFENQSNSYVKGLRMSKDIFFNLQYFGGQNNLLLFYNRKELTIKKNYSLLLLLDDGTVLSLNLTTNPINDIWDLCKFPLSNDDMNKLKTSKFIKWRITNENGEPLLSGLNNCCSHIYNGNDISKRISCDYFQRFIIDFINVVNTNAPKEELEEQQDDIPNNNPKTCFVYLMIDTTNNFHKIGISNNPKYREHTLQSDKPTIELLCAKEYPTRDIAISIESALHRVYASKRIRGEWFNLDVSDVENIKQTLK